MPGDLSPREWRDAIANSISIYLKSYEVADFCVGLGLEPPGEHEDPFRSKAVYVRGKLAARSGEELKQIARKVAQELGDHELAEQLRLGAPRGVDGELKNVIFASVGRKPRIVMVDALNNVIDVVENADSCLIYDQPLAEAGLTWGDLRDWWSTRSVLTGAVDIGRELYQRLSQSLASPPEKLLFKSYCERYGGEYGDRVPALLPQVYLHYDPYVRAQRVKSEGEIKRERMDFLMLMPNQTRVVIEVDGKQHYSTDDGRASPARYSEMMAEDRKIRLRGYEVYRFGGAELMQENAPAELQAFFDSLLEIHSA